jgi:hypothetical protein
MKWYIAGALLLLCFVVPVRAGSIVGPAYLVEGTVVFNGNNSCGGPCVEIVEFSFIFEWIQRDGFLGMGNYGSYVPGSLEAQQSGTMGSAPITSSNDGQIICCGSRTYIPMNAFAGELDLDVSFFDSTGNPPSPVVGPAYLFGCSPECFNQFGPNVGVGSPYEATFTATAIPEPSSLVLLAGAMFLFAVISQSLKRRDGKVRARSQG